MNFQYMKQLQELNARSAKDGIDISSVAQKHTAMCTTHEKNFGVVRIEHFNGAWMDAEAKFAKDGWTGDGPHNSKCPECSKRVFALKDLK